MKKDKTVRISGDVSPHHDASFKLIKGFYSCKNNGEALQRIIDLALPMVIIKLKAKGGK
jgi:hypothetical protein